MKLSKLIYICFILCVLMTLIFNIQALPILFSIILVFLSFITIRKYNISETKFLIIILSLTFLLHILCVFCINNPQISDFKTLFDMSQDFVSGQISESTQHYMNTWPYQTFFVLYQTIFLKIFNSELFLKIINAIINVFITLLIYKISKKVSDEKSAQFITILYTFFINKIMYSNILSNQIPSALLLLLGICLLFSDRIKNEKIRTCLFAVCIAFSNLLRPEGIVILLSYVCYEIYKAFKNKKIINPLLNIIIFVCIYLVICNGITFLINKKTVTQSNDIGAIYKIVIGLNIDSGGKWTANQFNKLYSFNDKESLLAYEKESIINSLTDIRVFKLFAVKINTFWNGFDFSWTLNHLASSGINVLFLNVPFNEFYDFIKHYDLTIWIIILILSLIGTEIKDEKSNLISIIIIANFIVYLFIEVQGRYAYLCRILLFILASKGIKYINEKIANSKIKIKESEKND